VKSVTAVPISDLLLLVYAVLFKCHQSRICVCACVSTNVLWWGRGFTYHYVLYKQKYHFGI